MNNTALVELRKQMQQEGIDLYLVPTADYHESEYVGAHFQARRFLTGFTGSAGTAVVTADHAGLWTDGRYFIQAAAQLEGSGFQLYKMGEEKVPAIEEFLKDRLPQGGVIGFDGRVMNTKKAREYEKIAEEKGGSLRVDCDLTGRIWSDRPGLPDVQAFLLEESYSGEKTSQKLQRVRDVMKEAGADYHVLTTLPDIAWLLNIRGGDISHVPVVLSYLILSAGEARLYVREEVLNEEVRTALGDCGVTFHSYDDFYGDLGQLPRGSRVLFDGETVNYRAYQAMAASLGEEALIQAPNPTEGMKAVKNEVEIENTRRAHVKDAVAMTRFLYRIKWLMKKQDGALPEEPAASGEEWKKTKLPLTEYTAAKMADELRAEQEGFLDLSFDTISGYGPNAALPHYQAQRDLASELKPEGFLLVDSGGHYLEGTTDITRTISLGFLTPEQKRNFTLTAMGCLRLSAVKFAKGAAGRNLDILARQPLWEAGLDFNHGTGHGVGHILNVHEGPQSIRMRTTAGQNTETAFEPGMITSDEPGLYLEGRYGIRTENELLCVEAEKTDFGQFYRFEILTLVPIDLDAIDVSVMEQRDIALLNAYHKRVRETLTPYLNEEEAAWLSEATRAVG